MFVMWCDNPYIPPRMTKDSPLIPCDHVWHLPHRDSLIVAGDIYVPWVRQKCNHTAISFNLGRYVNSSILECKSLALKSLLLASF